MSTYTPRQVVEQTGLSVDTLRYYERIGLLDGISRTRSGQRQYCDDDIQWLRVLRCLRETGMPIARMREYVELARNTEAVAERIALLEEHDRDVEERIATLRSQRKHIREKIEYYRSIVE
jgi:DNA-binding transcriptional MerR regulator